MLNYISLLLLLLIINSFCKRNIYFSKIKFFYIFLFYNFNDFYIERYWKIMFILSKIVTLGY